MMTFRAFYYADIHEQLLESGHASEIQKMVSDGVDDSVEELAKKLKAWAVQHLTLAMKSGESVELLKKIINNPLGVTKQLVAAIITKKSIPTLTDKEK
jgi:hypothetical protein